MIDPIKLSQYGVVYETCKGGKLTFLYTNLAVMRAEQAGLSATAGTVTNMILTIWALLLYTRPKVTIEEAAELLDAEQAAGRFELLNRACLDAMRKAGVLKDEAEAVPTEPPAEIAAA